MKLLVDAHTHRFLGAQMIGTGCDEVLHCILYAMYAGAPYTTLERAVPIHPRVAELLPTMLKRLEPLECRTGIDGFARCTTSLYVTGDVGSGELQRAATQPEGACDPRRRWRIFAIGSSRIVFKATRILRLIEECLRAPFTGSGKPEPLRHSLAGSWSRRIDREHRLVYRVEGDRLIVLACRYHH